MRKVSFITLLSVFFLIWVGGMVRSTGAGMGCPDWPKCFDQWVPPTAENQLPVDYKEVYAAKRASKNEKIVSYLTRFGFAEKALEIKNDQSILVEPPFNPVKTWIEYLNRLVGVVVGLLVFMTFLKSLSFWKGNKKITFAAFLVLILTGLQGWIGSIVVSTNLLPWTITIHMLLALVIMLILVYLAVKTNPSESSSKLGFQLNGFLVIAMVLSVVQVAFGTQVREAIDMIAIQLGNDARSEWVDYLPLVFYIHRSFSLLILVVNVFIAFKIWKGQSQNTMIRNLIIILIVSIILEILSGVIMAYFAIPAVLQPIHLLLGSVIFGVQAALLMFSTVTKTDIKKSLSN